MLGKKYQKLISKNKTKFAALQTELLIGPKLTDKEVRGKINNIIKSRYSLK